MKSKKIFLVSTLCLLGAAAFSVTALNSGDLINSVIGTNGTQLWNHYDGVAPTFESNGIKEYWVSCTDPLHTIQFTAPTGDDVDITDKGAPSAEFINALPADDTRLIKQWQRAYSFEDGLVPEILTETKGNVVSVTSSTATHGSKALQIELTGQHTRLSFNRAWLEGIFNLEGANELYIDVKADTPAKDLYYNSISNKYFVERYEASAVASSGVRTHWKTITFEKADLADLEADNVLFRVDNSTIGNKIYIDNIRYGSTSVISSFERNNITEPGDHNYKIIDGRAPDNDVAEAMVRIPNGTVEISDAYASHGAASLHIKTTEATMLNLYIPYSYYASLSGTGILFDLYVVSCDAMHVYPLDGSLPRNYLNGDNFGKWTTYYLPFDLMQTVGTDWIRIMANRVNNNFDLYVDNIRIATDYEVEFENTVSYDAFIPMINFDDRNTVQISSTQAHTGTTSAAITTSENHTMLFKLSDRLYDLIPQDGGVKFYMYCDVAFNGNDGKGNEVHYWQPVSTWKEYIIPKANIDTTAGRHYVTTAGYTGTIYLDDVSIVSALPTSEAYNGNILTLPVDATWYA